MVETDEPVVPASTQYGDFVGTAVADGHGGSVLFELAEVVGLDLDRYQIVGIEFGHYSLRKDGLTILAVDRAIVGGDLERYFSAHGEVPVIDFKVHDLATIELLAHGLKRLQVQLLARWLPDGVGLRRTIRDDLNYSGD